MEADMVPHEVIIGIRNILLVQLVTIILAPSHVLLISREITRIWQSINAPFLQRKPVRRKGSTFWEIDMTKFEP